MTEREYPCGFCDTTQEQQEKLVELTLKHEGKIYIFKNVPAHVCPNCGHRYYDGPMIVRLERLIREDALLDAKRIEAYEIPYSAVSE